MHSNRLLLALLLASLVFLQGCVELLLVGGVTAAVAAHDRRTMGAFIDDKAMVVKATSAINAAEGLTEEVHINVTSVNGVVLLSGEAPTSDARDQVLAAVRTVPGVRRIVNEIRIAAPAPISSRNNDTWLTSKVKAKLVGVENLDSSHIKVITENAVVYLMGLVKKEEAELAAAGAAEVSGIERVVKLFEYLD